MSYYVTAVAVEIVDGHSIYIRMPHETMWLATCKDADTAETVADVIALQHRLPVERTRFSGRHRKKKRTQATQPSDKHIAR